MVGAWLKVQGTGTVVTKLEIRGVGVKLPPLNLFERIFSIRLSFGKPFLKFLDPEGEAI